MEITLECSCGATFSLGIESPLYASELKGMSTEWQERHKGCMATAAQTAEPGEQFSSSVRFKLCSKLLETMGGEWTEQLRNAARTKWQTMPLDTLILDTIAALENLKQNTAGENKQAVGWRMPKVGDDVVLVSEPQFPAAPDGLYEIGKTYKVTCLGSVLTAKPPVGQTPLNWYAENASWGVGLTHGQDTKDNHFYMFPLSCVATPETVKGFTPPEQPPTPRNPSQFKRGDWVKVLRLPEYQNDAAPGLQVGMVGKVLELCLTVDKPAPTNPMPNSFWLDNQCTGVHVRFRLANEKYLDCRLPMTFCAPAEPME